MEIPARRPSYTDQLWLSMPPGNSSASASASSSPAASPRVGNRFSPGLSSPSPTRKSFTSRRSLSPIAVRPSVLSLGLTAQGKHYTTVHVHHIVFAVSHNPIVV